MARVFFKPLLVGWRVQNDKMVLMFTDQIPAAPSELLTCVRCRCKEDGCGSLTCSCKKHCKAFR